MGRILIIGGSGLTGSVLTKMASDEWDVYATYLSNPPTKGDSRFSLLDIRKKETLQI